MLNFNKNTMPSNKNVFFIDIEAIGSGEFKFRYYKRELVPKLKIIDIIYCLLLIIDILLIYFGYRHIPIAISIVSTIIYRFLYTKTGPRYLKGKLLDEKVVKQP